MLVNIHFQKCNRYKFLESYLYCNNGGLEPRQRTQKAFVAKMATLRVSMMSWIRTRTTKKNPLQRFRKNMLLFYYLI